MKITSTKPYPQGGRGFALLQLEDCQLNESKCQIVVKRPLFSKQFLSIDGWVVSEIKLTLDCIDKGNGQVDVIFPSYLVRHLDSANYYFSVFDTHSHLMGESVLRWNGGTYRGPIDIPQLPPQVISSDNWSDNTEGINSDLDNKVYKTSAVHDDWADPVDTPPPASEIIDKVYKNLSSFDNDHRSDSQDIPKLDYPPFKEVQLFNCYKCKNKIFFGVSKCPFCNSEYK